MFRQSLVVFAVLCGICASLVTSEGSFTPRIVGGKAAIDVKLPWMTSISYLGSHICGGSIINKRTILTAAHCLKYLNPEYLQVRVGSMINAFGGDLMSVESFNFHEKYSTDKVIESDFDIGVIRLASELEFTEFVQPIALPEPGEMVAVGSDAIISGWGYRSILGPKPQYLQYAVVSIIDQDICRELLKGGVTDRMVCAGVLEGGRDACLLDSGGPLVVNKKLVGIVSWGNGCGLKNKPGVYTRISEFVPWVSRYLSTYNETLN